MVNFYVMMVKKEKITIDEVPDLFKKEVIEKLGGEKANVDDIRN